MIVSDEAFAYLKWQAGDIYDLHTDRAAWEAGYRAKLQAQYENIKPWLPSFEPGRITLDIGSGLGGIDAVIANRHYKLDGYCYGLYWLVDGYDDLPGMTRHNDTHNDMWVARRFLKANGTNWCGWTSPDGRTSEPWPTHFDLVISFAAWCFHFPPSEYLKKVAAACSKDTVLILDVRRGKDDWQRDLERHFNLKAIILEERKFRRMVFTGC